jgi:hypothetical protein
MGFELVGWDQLETYYFDGIAIHAFISIYYNNCA